MIKCEELNDWEKKRERERERENGGGGEGGPREQFEIQSDKLMKSTQSDTFD